MPYGTRGQVRRSRSRARVFNFSDELRVWRHKHNLSQSEAALEFADFKTYAARMGTRPRRAGRSRANRDSEDRPLSDCRTSDNAELRREALGGKTAVRSKHSTFRKATSDDVTSDGRSDRGQKFQQIISDPTDNRAMSANRERSAGSGVRARAQLGQACRSAC